MNKFNNFFSRNPGAIVFAIIALTALISGCASQPVSSTPDAPGLFSGLLHGFFVVFSLIASIFGDYRIYAFPNSGGGYDFGFFLGVMALCASVMSN